MTIKKFKNVLPLFIGILIFSMVASIVPTNLLVEAASTQTTGYLTLAEAKEIALKKINDSTAEVTNFNIDFNQEKPYYIMEVKTKAYVYRVDIDASSKNIIRFEVTSVVANKNITIDQAKEIALKKVNDSTAQVTNLKISSNEKNPYYIIEIQTKTHIYTIDVDIATGNIINFQVKNIEVKTNITLAQAKNIALKQINDVTAEVVNAEANLNGVNPYYIIEVKTKTYGYTVEIDGTNGKVISLEASKIIVDKPGEQLKKYITKDVAKVIALNQVEDKNKEVLDLVVDIEDDRVYYFVEIRTPLLRYTVKVNAETGEVAGVKHEANNSKHVKPNNNKENKDKGKDNKNNQKYITKERAIEIAVKKIDNKKAKIEEIDFEYKKNPPVYEIEMEDDKYEYKIVINAITGQIVEFEKEKD